MSRKWNSWAILFLFVSGCGSRPVEKAAEARIEKAATKKDGDDHKHEPGQHGGILVDVGRGKYHVEAVFEKGGLLKLYTLGGDESKIVDVDSQILKAFAKDESATEAIEIDLNPVPRAGDKTGRTSQFVGKLPAELVGKQVTVTIPIFAIDGERFRVGFTSAATKHVPAMPEPAHRSRCC